MERIEQIRECNACEWIGWQSECVAPKHLQSFLVCPECGETTEQVTPNQVKGLREYIQQLEADIKEYEEAQPPI